MDDRFPMDRQRLYTHLQQYVSNYGKSIQSFYFLSDYLSPVRDQRNGGQCAFVATITSVEMIFRMSAIQISGWSGPYFFDIDDVYNNFYDVYPNLPRAKKKKQDVKGKEGTRINFILDFVRDKGLLPTSCCYDPRFKNLLSQFDKKATRCQIDSYEKLRLHEVVACAKVSPVIFVMVSYVSFLKCKTIIYEGPTKGEKLIPEELIGYHAAVIVGSVEIVAPGQCEEFVLVQNSHGDPFGFEGFTLMKLDYPGVFKEFWKPKKNVALTRKRKFGGTSPCP